MFTTPLCSERLLPLDWVVWPVGRTGERGLDIEMLNATCSWFNILNGPSFSDFRVKGTNDWSIVEPGTCPTCVNHIVHICNKICMIRFKGECVIISAPLVTKWNWESSDCSNLFSQHSPICYWPAKHITTAPNSHQVKVAVLCRL